MELFSLGVSMVPEKRLSVFPAVQASDLSNSWDIHDIEKRGSASVAEHGPLHVSGLDLAPDLLDLAIGTDQGLRDVQRLAIVLGEAELDRDLVLFGCGAEELHLGGIDLEGVCNVFLDGFEINCTLPDIRVLIEFFSTVCNFYAFFNLPYPVRVAWDEALGESD